MLPRREYLDASICVMKIKDGQLELYEAMEYLNGRDTEMEVMLEPGQYVILPKTNGVTMKRIYDKPMEG